MGLNLPIFFVIKLAVVFVFLGAGAFQASSQSTVSVDDYGAVGDGVTYSHVAIQNAITAAGPGGTVLFSSDSVYSIAQRLIALSAQTWLGRGATLRRCDSIRSRLTAAAPAGTKSIEVEDASQFEVGMDVTPIRGPAMQDGEGGFDWDHRIVSISGNVITMENGLGQAYSAGDFFITIHPLIEVPCETEGVSMTELRFDGNRDKNYDNHAWQLAQIIVLCGNNQRVENCLFENSWGDAINLGGLKPSGSLSGRRSGRGRSRLSARQPFRAIHRHASYRVLPEMLRDFKCQIPLRGAD